MMSDPSKSDENATMSNNDLGKNLELQNQINISSGQGEEFIGKTYEKLLGNKRIWQTHVETREKESIKLRSNKCSK